MSPVIGDPRPTTGEVGMDLIAATQDRTLLLDGAMGTNLFDLGLANGAPGELWQVAHCTDDQFPAAVTSAHEFVSCATKRSDWRTHVQLTDEAAAELRISIAEVALGS